MPAHAQHRLRQDGGLAYSAHRRVFSVDPVSQSQIVRPAAITKHGVGNNPLGALRTVARSLTAIACLLNLAIGLTWWFGNESLHQGKAFDVDVRVGNAFSPDHPMWFWAGMFMFAATGQLIALLRQRPQLGGLFLAIGAGVVGFYGTCSGAAALHPFNVGVPPTGFFAFTLALAPMQIITAWVAFAIPARPSGG